ncbi:OmpP1/FadL family transporter [Pinisolibacter sp.]|uniref:OmpP1/FadL family transporter n=1 Tax=Pinisolibacter sp. TaxID=2172024 RepID=UPI002FDEDDA6
MTSNYLRGSVSALGLVAALTFGAATASATEGYFQTGYGTIQKAQAGAGVANAEDAMTLSVNPAGLVDVGNQFNIAFTLFSPSRDATATGLGMLPATKVESGSEYFLMPNMAYARQIDSESAWGIAIYGNGGMNTNYPAVFGGAMCPAPGMGLFCAGVAGVNLEQMFLTVGYARRMGDISIGIQPIVAMQKFRANGILSFAAFSSDPTNLSNRDNDYSFGAGVRAGIQWTIQPGVRLGLTGTTPIWSTKLDKYAGLFEGQGSFDIPGTVSAGLAWDATKDLTLMLDWRHIFYSQVGAVGNTSTILGLVPLGTSGGPGFGWRDVDAFSIAAAYKATKDLTLRAGYSHNTNPIRARDVMFNVFASGVVTDHFSGGASYKLNPNSGIELAVGYVPRSSVTGPAMGGQTVRISMEQWEASVGYTYKF